MKNFKSLYFIALACSFVFLSFSIKNGNGLESLFSQKWVTKTYSDPKIELETPKELVKTKMEVPKNLKESVDKMNNFSYDDDDLMISVSTMAYKSGTTANLRGAAAGALHEMQTRGGIDEFSYVNKDTTISGIGSIIQRGTFKKGSDKIDFSNLYSTKENKLWQVMVAHKAGDVYGKKISEKVIKSVKIK